MTSYETHAAGWEEVEAEPLGSWEVTVQNTMWAIYWRRLT